MVRYAADASSKGGTTVVRLPRDDCVTADLTSAAVEPGNTDHSNATVPVTKGTAKLVPLSVRASPSCPRLVMRSPGALSPRLAIEPARLDARSGLPSRPQAVT